MARTPTKPDAPRRPPRRGRPGCEQPGPPPPAPGGDSGGYLLVEILIAIAVFAIGFLAVGTLLVGTARNNTTGNLVTQAVMLASDRLEFLKNQAIADLPLGSFEDPDNPLDGRGNPGGVFVRRWVIDDPVGNDSSRRIRVTVSWSRLGQVRTIDLTTLTRGRGT